MVASSCGHIEIAIPAVRSAEPPYDLFPQAEGPVPVLLNPSTVETWQVLGAAGGAFANSRTSPPLTTGQAHVEIPPDTDPEVMRVSVRDFLTQKMRCCGCSPCHRWTVAGGTRATLIELLAAVERDEDEQARP